MLGGLSLRYRVLIATAATALMGSFAHEPVKAADLGGDCCADLEERVAELEATTVRKGNKKVSITLYGDVNTRSCSGTMASRRTPMSRITLIRLHASA